MEAQVDDHVRQYMIYDARGLSGTDAVYEAAVKITDEIMDGIGRLTHSNTIGTATLFITGTGAQLILLARSFDEELIAPAFRSTLKNVTFYPEMGFIQRYVIPILDAETQP